MLVRYKGPKKEIAVVVPWGTKSPGAIRNGAAKFVTLAPEAELPDRDAVLYATKDPGNFEIVGEAVVEAPGDRGGEAVTAEADVHEGLVTGGVGWLPGGAIGASAHEVEALDGTEFAEAIEAAPAPKRRGRPKKAS